MITLSGQLSVRTVMGRNGAFIVGKLATSIGEFSIKDAVLDQYAEGKYQGEFVITQIKPSYYSTRSGSLIVEIRAWLDAMTLDAMDSLSGDEAAALAPAVQDPAEEEAARPKPEAPSTAQAPAASPPAAAAPWADDVPFGMTTDELKKGMAAKPKGKAAHSSETTPSPEAADAALFGLLWPLGDSVQLDATLERFVQRKQIERLKTLGFAFDYKRQLWCKTAAR